jgi:hypothetical protein
MRPYGVHSSFEVNGNIGRCSILSCIFPGHHIWIHDHYNGSVSEQNLCQFHFRTGASPFSMEYQDADALLGVPKHRASGSTRGNKRLVSGKDCMLVSAPFSDSNWDVVARRSVIGNYKPHIRLARVSKSLLAHVRDAPDITIMSAPSELKYSHFLDPMYNALGLLSVKSIEGQIYRYSLCGEKVFKSDISGEPTCESCIAMARAERISRELPKPAPRPVLLTLPKPVEPKPDFEELLLDGLIDDAAFANRRNWGERSGKVWNDPSQGVQRAKGLRWDRGGVNRKRG